MSPTATPLTRFCLQHGCQHPPSGPDAGRLAASLANFCHCCARRALDAYPLPGDDQAAVGEC